MTLEISKIPAWNLYGEDQAFPDVLHCEKITDRAAGLDWIISSHRHPHLHQFFMIKSGAIEMDADGVRLQPEAPCVITIPKGTVHGFSFAAKTDGYVVTVPVQYLPEIFDPSSSTSGPLSKFSVAPADDKILAMFEELHLEHEGRGPARIAMLKAQASVLACLVMRRLPIFVENVHTESNARFHQFEELVQNHFRDNWKLNDYAKSIGLSARHLGRLCRSATGQPPQAYIETIAMQEACRLLVYTRESIAEIGYQLGFEDPAYFSRVFRRHCEQTPREYRAAFEKE